MKVMCICKAWKPMANELKKPRPEFGEICEVLDVKENNLDVGLPGLYYKLAGYNKHSGFHSKEFVTVSDIDEAEMIRNYETKKTFI